MNDQDSKLLSENYKKVQEGMWDRAAAHTAGATSGWGQAAKGAGRKALQGLGAVGGVVSKKAGNWGKGQGRKAAAHFKKGEDESHQAKISSLTGGAITDAMNMANDLQLDMRKVLETIDPADPAMQKLQAFEADLSAAINKLKG
jgi:hypothetical protein